MLDLLRSYMKHVEGVMNKTDRTLSLFFICIIIFFSLSDKSLRHSAAWNKSTGSNFSFVIFSATKQKDGSDTHAFPVAADEELPAHLFFFFSIVTKITGERERE